MNVLGKSRRNKRRRGDGMASSATAMPSLHLPDPGEIILGTEWTLEQRQAGGLVLVELCELLETHRIQSIADPRVAPELRTLWARLIDKALDTVPLPKLGAVWRIANAPRPALVPGTHANGGLGMPMVYAEGAECEEQSVSAGRAPGAFGSSDGYWR